jgi:hypothetical protein
LVRVYRKFSSFKKALEFGGEWNPFYNKKGVEHTEVQQKSIPDQKLKDLKVKNYLFQTIDRTIIETILNRDIVKHIWNSMKQKYQGSMRVKRAQL